MHQCFGIVKADVYYANLISKLLKGLNKNVPNHTTAVAKAVVAKADFE